MSTRPSHAPTLAALGVFLAVSVYSFQAPLACLDRCFIDAIATRGAVGGMGLSDMRLNTWILAWVQHILASSPLDLFHANAFYPAGDSLAGSEHLLGLALLTWPLRLVTDSSVLIYQVATVLSGLILGLTTFALARWLSSSPGIGILAGVVAMLMPWRTTELIHLQLLGAHWIPLIWLLSLRLLLDEARRSDAYLLCAVLLLQLLTSYYLAYFVTLSLGVLIPGAVLGARLRWKAALRLAAPLAFAYAPLLVLSLPYLRRSHQDELSFGAGLELGSDSAFLHNELVVQAWQALVPRLSGIGSSVPSGDLQYSVPASILLFGLFALAFAISRRVRRDAFERRELLGTRLLLACVLAAFLMMLWKVVIIAGVPLKLPSYWAAAYVPGFSNLRAPIRWGILISIAMPVLAALGFHGAAVRFGKTLTSRPGLRAVCIGAALVVLLIGLPVQRIPAREVWPDPAPALRAYDELRQLPDGPLLEIPWWMDPLRSIPTESEYLLASTFHWRPLLNGYTAYPPHTYLLLRRLAQGLPEPQAVDALHRLVDLRWIVVHLDALPAPSRATWLELSSTGRLRLAYQDQHTLIVEMKHDATTGSLMEPLRSRERRERTLGGASRSALDPKAVAGRLEGPREVRFRSVFGPASRPVAITIENSSEVDWPGFDYQTEGLVQLRYVFALPDGEPIKAGRAFLDADIPAGSQMLRHPWISPPAYAGRFRLCLDLVQRVDGETRPLPIPPVEVLARVVGPSRDKETPTRLAAFADFAARFAGLRPPREYPCGV
jgi:hypothetical protein